MIFFYRYRTHHHRSASFGGCSYRFLEGGTVLNDSVSAQAPRETEQLPTWTKRSLDGQLNLGRVDVCFVTRRAWPEISRLAEKNLARVPYHHVILEQSRPLGLARQRAIAQVDTPWFVFLDDDVELGDSWWADLCCSVKPEVGAVTGTLSIKGMGSIWDTGINNWLRIQKSKATEITGRASTHNALIRTDLVRDWTPADPRLETYEDYQLTQYVRAKGYRWLEAPALAYHLKSWTGMAKNALWEARTKKYSGVPSSRFGDPLRSLIWICLVLISPKYPLPVKVVIWWRHAFLILGWLTQGLQLLSHQQRFN